MDKFIFPLGLLFCLAAIVIGGLWPEMPVWIFLAMCGAGLMMVGADG